MIGFPHRAWGRPVLDLTVVVDDPVGRGMIRSSPGGEDPRRLVVRPAFGRDHARIDEVRRANSEWLSPWEATLPAGSTEILPGLGEYRRRADGQQRRGEALFLVVEADGRAIGQVSIANVHGGAMSQAMIGYWIAGEWAGRGVGPLVTAVALDMALGDLELHRVEICVRPENDRSLAVCRRLGLREEGLRERYMNIAGRWADHVVFVADAESVPPGGYVVAGWGRGVDE
ncbi:GNAT family N-acetyltransferase [Actinomyces sp. B33]|uniref:GNAT family N-acetyltransferase n=1 Tax=Actinomyces sp. B33 TaxID=2942131 RepID=UPI00233FB5FF|nr:GNAT family protein [Actinomyces sp. B33]MDC4232172.1 GNAT family N-acetyltransferase [Actinomyces sp. B33]